MNLKSILPLILLPSIVIAEEYRSISNLDYSRFETGPLELDQFAFGSTWYFDRKVTLGPLNEFEYINKTSNIFGAYTRFEGMNADFDDALIGGEYFAGNLLVGGSYRNLEDFDVVTGTVGYLLNSNFLVSLDAVKAEDIDAEYFVNARYDHQLGGTNYIGFHFRTDDEFDTKEISSRYFTQLASENYLAAEVSYTIFDNADDIWALDGDYYFNQRTSLGLGIAKDEVYSLDFTHFFTRNIAVELGYTTSRNDDTGLDLDLDAYQLGITAQF